MTSIGIEYDGRSAKTKSILRYLIESHAEVFIQMLFAFAGTSPGVGKHSPSIWPIFPTKRHRHHLSFAHVLWHDGMVRRRMSGIHSLFPTRLGDESDESTDVKQRSAQMYRWFASRWEKPLGWLYLCFERFNLGMTSHFVKKQCQWMGQDANFGSITKLSLPKAVWSQELIKLRSEMMTSLFFKSFVWLGHVCFFPKYIRHFLHSRSFSRFIKSQIESKDKWSSARVHIGLLLHISQYLRNFDGSVGLSDTSRHDRCSRRWILFLSSVKHSLRSEYQVASILLRKSHI